MIAAGVTTAIAVQFATKYLEDRVILAARAEMAETDYATLAQNNVETTQNSEFLTTTML